ncbi:antitoxin MazE-like protein [Sphingomonas sp.]|uniref:antitoxin MazE-like protein n=1 Tax=Sphingomonas sp. TaxID=28214 RepID=UPI00286CA47D|nr:antitoxin MazE-like protein [Sphingomonas sp.]
MTEASPERQDKFRAYRAKKKAQGLREVRVWVPDTRTPGFQEAIDRACRAINASEDSRRVQREIDAMTAELWADMD